MLTFAGANVDIYIGASAPVIAWLSMRGWWGQRLALIGTFPFMFIPGFFVPLAVVLHVLAIWSITSHARTALDTP